MKDPLIIQDPRNLDVYMSAAAQQAQACGLSREDAVEGFEREYLRTVIRATRNINEAAAATGDHRNTFTRRVKKLILGPRKPMQSVVARAARKPEVA